MRPIATLATLLALAASACGNPVAPAAAGIPRCEAVEEITALEEHYRDSPIYVANRAASCSLVVRTVSTISLPETSGSGGSFRPLGRLRPAGRPDR